MNPTHATLIYRHAKLVEAEAICDSGGLFMRLLSRMAAAGEAGALERTYKVQHPARRLLAYVRSS